MTPPAAPEPDSGPGGCWPVAAVPGGRVDAAATADAMDDDAPAAACGRAPDEAAAGADAGDGETCGGSAVLAGRGAWPPPPPVSSASHPLTWGSKKYSFSLKKL